MTTVSQPESDCPAAPVASRVILLGASNLTINFPLIVHSLAQSLPGPLEIFAAHGHGRSFCQWSYVLNRGLPSIVDSSLWDDLAGRPPALHNLALITDVGNDLLYGHDPASILQQVETCMQRIRACSSQLLCVRLPLQRLMRLSNFGFRIARSILFPRARRTWNELRAMAFELDEQFAELAVAYDAPSISPPLHWYGADPIHIRRGARGSAWNTILNQWSAGPEVNVSPPANGTAGEIWFQRPALRTLFGKETRTSQPSGELIDGTRIWLY
ncbi:hypothetical protein [Planctomicrobium sp. SH664]|uniref:hypothetical protein n=1 Tax=Planctomicrobium sp. SH664 TaxID=3448125 RepID=UPI003F5ADE2E